MSALTLPDTPIAWPDRNRAVLDLGLTWLRALLANENAAALRAAYEAERRCLWLAGQPAAIDRISRDFGLAPFDEDCLLLAAAPFLDSQMAPPFEIASARLALAMFTGGDRQAWQLGFQRLAPQAPLRRHRLIAIDGMVPSLLAPLVTDERVARALAGEEDPDPRLAALRIGVPETPVPPRQLEAVSAWAEAVRTSPRPIGIVLGPPRSGRAGVAAHAAKRLGFTLVGLRPVFPADFSLPRLEAIVLIAREARLRGEAVLLDASKPEMRDAVLSLCDELEAPIFVLATAPLPGMAGLPTLRLPPLDFADRTMLWRQALGPAALRLGSGCERLADQFQLAPAAVAAIAGRTLPDEGSLWAACRDAAGEDLGPLAERITPRFGWDDIVLPVHVAEQLRAIAGQVRHRATVLGQGGFMRRMPGGTGVAALFAGPSGTGKTLAAEIVAGDLKLDLCRVDLSSVVSKYIGETERNLRAVFDAAEAGGLALFFDEADALFGERSEVKDSHDRYANLEVSYLLQRMERFSGLAILATNMKAHLDAAFLRRLRFVVDFPFPDSVQRRAMWARAFPPETPTRDLNFDALSRLEIAGGNIAVVAVNAAFLAASDGMPVGMAHINRAARDEFRKLDKEFRPVGMEGR